MDELGIRVVVFGTGLLCGAVVLWLVLLHRSRTWAREQGELRARLEDRDQRIASLDAVVSERNDVLERLSDQLTQLRERRARLEAQIEGERRSSDEKLELLGDAEHKLREAFQSLSADALRQNSRSFLDLAQASLGEHRKGASADYEARQQAIDRLVQPLRDSLQRVDGKLQEIEQARVGAYSSLTDQVRSLVDTQQRLQTETAQLVQALRAPTVRGRWGEMQLKRVVEMAGMLEHCDFQEQKTGGDEGRLRPDLLVRLPGGKRVVVDAKAPLAGYLASFEARDDAEREARLKDHARQVREHISRLGAKGYWEQFRPAPDFVVMFLPGETFFSAALQHDPTLIEYGVDRRVIPASPTTLIALLRSVAFGWQQHKIAENAQAISDLGREMYDRVRVMAQHFDELRRNLERTVDAFNRTVGSMENRVLVAARRFRELGAASSDPVPEIGVIDRAPRRVHPTEREADPQSDDSAYEHEADPTP